MAPTVKSRFRGFCPVYFSETAVAEIGTAKSGMSTQMESENRIGCAMHVYEDLSRSLDTEANGIEEMISAVKLAPRS